MVVAVISRLRCWLGWPAWRWTDPTGGDPDLGGPVLIQVCASCQNERGMHP